MVDGQELAAWCSHELAEWVQRIQALESGRVDPNSPLAQDPPLPDGISPGVLAWRAIGTAGEHAAAAHLMQSPTNGGVATKPFLTLARTVMMGAARALYLLEPETSSERHVHGLQLLRAESQDIQNLVRNWDPSAQPDGPSELQIASDALRTECDPTYDIVVSLSQAA